MAEKNKSPSGRPTSGRKKNTPRGLSWSDEETACLLSIWCEQNVEEQLEDPKKNKGAIYNMLSNDMKNQGYEKSSAQCKVRMHTLKRSYRD